jgi:ribonuclease Z
MGQKGTKKFVKKIMDAWADERKLRISYESRASAKAFDIQVTEFKSIGILKLKILNIKYFEVDHKPVKYAYGFCFTNKNKKLTISGDTRPCENLMKYAQKSDVLLHEVFIEEKFCKLIRCVLKKLCITYKVITRHRLKWGKLLLLQELKNWF